VLRLGHIETAGRQDGIDEALSRLCVPWRMRIGKWELEWLSLDLWHC
jgi:hypothetical protein